jgi:hypothetical protein
MITGALGQARGSADRTLVYLVRHGHTRWPPGCERCHRAATMTCPGWRCGSPTSAPQPAHLQAVLGILGWDGTPGLVIDNKPSGLCLAASRP